MTAEERFPDKEGVHAAKCFPRSFSFGLPNGSAPALLPSKVFFKKRSEGPSEPACGFPVCVALILNRGGTSLWSPHVAATVPVLESPVCLWR